MHWFSSLLLVVPKEGGKGRPLEEVVKEEGASKEKEVMEVVASLVDLAALLQICHA